MSSLPQSDVRSTKQRNAALRSTVLQPVGHKEPPQHPNRSNTPRGLLTDVMNQIEGTLLHVNCS